MEGDAQDLAHEAWGERETVAVGAGVMVLWAAATAKSANEARVSNFILARSMNYELTLVKKRMLNECI